MSSPPRLDRVRLTALRDRYRDGLLEDTLPFWIPACVDREHGGFHFALDADGSLFETDKGVWQQGRFTWLLGTLHAEVEPRAEWLDLCAHGVEFLRSRCFDGDGRAWFHLTREGEPIRKRRYAYGEAFAAMGFAAHARAAGDPRSHELALETWTRMRRLMTTPGLLEPKTTAVRPLASIGPPMIRIGVAQTLREMEADARFDAEIDRCIEEIERRFVRPELGAVLECVGADGSFVDHVEGRTLNPGHALEAAWFILAEARHRGGDAALVALGELIVDLSWPWAWDETHGGVLYFRDVLGKPVQEYWHDMKFWWTHNEAILATLLAWAATGAPRHAERYLQVHEWAYSHFPDPEQCEWFGYLHRDGSPSSSAKGNLWKGPFHLPRMQLVAWKTCEDLLARDV